MWPTSTAPIRARAATTSNCCAGADKLDELRTLAGQIRQYFYKITLPWSDEGFRLLPANLYFDLMARMREFEAELRAGSRGFSCVSIRSTSSRCGRS